MKHILIVGGGIGGLCTAVMLQNHGYHVQIFESSSSVKPVGAGLGVGSNALQALYEAGVGKQIEEKGNALHKMVFQNDRGDLLNKMDFTVLAKEFRLNSLTIHRADLHAILYQAIAPGTIQFNKKCVDFEQNNKGAKVFFGDGSSAEGDLVIAADGIHSIFRKNLTANRAPRYAGYTCWRGVVEVSEKQFNQHTSYELWGKDGRIGIVPLQHNRIYWFACVNTKKNDPLYRNLKPTDVARIFADFPPHVTQLISSTNEAELLHHDIADIKPLDQFVYGRIVLLGDAAHATTPNMGQGAGQAMEDGIVFVRCLNKTNNIQEAFTCYERKRVKRTKKIINLSRQIGVGAQIENSFIIIIRNNLFRLVPSSILLKRFRFLLDVDLD
ncbi:MAG TPA: FAD-dependent monooxygenase [Virgibacillus sp.]|nr:FAD-dependent monooxygenase [Virgibacillus sp.]